jgi:hypothetical protein
MTEDDVSLDRRDFMRSGAATAGFIAGFSGLGAALSKEEDGDVSGVDGEFHILYGKHTSESEPYDPGELPDDLDGFFIENSANYLDNPAGNMNYFETNGQYAGLVDEMAENDTPVLMADVNLSTDGRVAETGLMAAEAGLGAGLAAKAGVDMDGFGAKEAGITGLAGWLLQPLASYASFMGSGQSEVTGEFVDSSNQVHPESFRLTRDFRNSVVAYKQLELMERRKEDSSYGTVWGSLHEGFENDLEREKENLLDSIERSKPAWETFVENDETVYSAVEFENYGGDWYAEEVHEFEELREIVE